MNGHLWMILFHQKDKLNPAIAGFGSFIRISINAKKRDIYRAFLYQNKVNYLDNPYKPTHTRSTIRKATPICMYVIIVSFLLKDW